MKFEIQKEVLIHAVGVVIKAISPKVSVPILSGLKITATSKEIIFVGSNNDISIQKTVPLEKNGDEKAKVHEEGSVVLNAKFLNELVRKVPKDDIIFTVEKNNVTKIKSGKSVFSLNGFPAEEYPKLPEIEGEADFTLSAGDLNSIVKQTAFAAATSELRPILTGINLNLKDGLKAIVTDSHRLAIKELKLAGEDRNVTIPAKALIELSKVFEDQEEQVEVILKDTQALFKSHNLLFYSRLLDGNFPQVSKLLPTTFNTTLKVDRKGLSAALNRCALIESKNKVVVLEVKDMQAVLTVSSPEVGQIEEYLEDFEIEGKDIKIAFSYKFTQDALSAFEDEKVQFQFVEALRPFIIKGEKCDSVTQLVLPVRT